MNIEDKADEFLLSLKSLSHITAYKLIGELSKGEIFLLGYLHSCGGTARSNALSQALGTSTARIAAAVKSMERKGWVYRESDQENKRKTMVHLTSEGHKHVMEYRERARSAVMRLLAELGEADTEDYLRITRRINEIAPGIQFE